MNKMSHGMQYAVLITVITFLYLFGVTFLTLSDSGIEQAKTIVPFLLGSVIGTLIGFYFGKKHEQPPIVGDRRTTDTTTTTSTETKGETP